MKNNHFYRGFRYILVGDFALHPSYRTLLILKELDFHTEISFVHIFPENNGENIKLAFKVANAIPLIKLIDGR